MDIIDQFTKILERDQVLTGDAVRERFVHVWQPEQCLNAKAVLLPCSTRDISHILKICHQNNQQVVIHGGITNLVGSTISEPHQVVISLERMNDILQVDVQSRAITAEAGVVLEKIQQAARDHGLFFPLNFGAKGSAQIGGIISSNAGGMRVLRYGMTRNLVIGLEAVLANGTVISSLKKILKDNSGYDLKQLFIGSEGTLGVVTKAVLRLYEAPQSRTTAIVALASYQKVVEFLKYMDQGLAGMLSAFELMWKITYQTLTQSRKAPIPNHYPYYVLIETLGSRQQEDQEMLFDLLNQALDAGIIKEAVPATSPGEVERLWKIREQVEPMIERCQYAQHFDISLPISLIGSSVEKVMSQLHQLPSVDIVFAFGHVADGNVHLVVGKSDSSASLTEKINELVYHPLRDYGGSVSAEHGIGIDKKPYLKYCRNVREIELMAHLKTCMDPQGILNPGRILDYTA